VLFAQVVCVWLKDWGQLAQYRGAVLVRVSEGGYGYPTTGGLAAEPGIHPVKNTMRAMSSSRGSYRDRHGRGLRRDIVTGTTGDNRLATFGQLVSGTCEYLQSAWPDELANLRWRIIDAPAIKDSSDEVARWKADKDRFEITIYRLPIERLGHPRRPDPLDERMHIEHYVFAAVGELIDRDPWSLIPHHDEDED
jgi:hypothetical protein